MKVLVTGAAGLLGSEVVRVFSERHAVTGVDLDDFDITDLDATVAAVRESRPAAVVHCAAWSDVDGAESAFEDAFRANGIGAKNVALAANEVGARVLHISTDYIFDGSAGRPYVESDLPHPIGAYGRSKWMGEQFVREMASAGTVVRTQALFGKRGSSFVKAILGRVEAGQPLEVVDDQTVCPTRAPDLAEALLRILEEGTVGIYHASSRGECTWFDFAAEILEQTGSADHPLSPIPSTKLDRPAPRPAYSVLRNLHLELTIGDTLPLWQDALERHLLEEGVT
ncbi:MAG: dTDP-4-dehydrorhamnose reductase [Planctomycetota bacterium]|jgi:dTDP-4-dehydrorhamnose reductase